VAKQALSNQKNLKLPKEAHKASQEEGFLLPSSPKVLSDIQGPAFQRVFFQNKKRLIKGGVKNGRKNKKSP
jgi:hypothetical protein